MEAQIDIYTNGNIEVYNVKTSELLNYSDIRELHTIIEEMESKTSTKRLQERIVKVSFNIVHKDINTYWKQYNVPLVIIKQLIKYINVKPIIEGL